MFIANSTVTVVAGLLGTLLLCINVSGLLIGSRPKNLIDDPELLFPDDVSIGYEIATEQLEAAATQDILDSEKVHVAIKTISSAVGHSWAFEKRFDYNLTIPIYWNYLLWGLNVVSPIVSRFSNLPLDDYYQRYEFNNWRRALERGVGLCSQHAIILDGYLKFAGLESKILRLDGHVVNYVKVDGNWWIADSDYGVAIPYELGTIESDLSLVRQFYSPIIKDELYLRTLENAYREQGNSMVESAAEYHGLKYVFIEEGSYFLKWLLPVIFLICSFFSYLLSKRTPV